MIVFVILHCDVFRVLHFQPFKQFIKWGLVLVIVLSDFSGTKHFHYHREILFFFRCFISQKENQCQQQHRSCCIPEWIVRLTAFWCSRFEQVRHQSLHIVIILQIYKRVIAMALFHIYQVKHSYFITFFFQKIPGISQIFPFWIKHHKRGICLHQIRLCKKSGLS